MLEEYKHKTHSSHRVPCSALGTCDRILVVSPPEDKADWHRVVHNIPDYLPDVVSWICKALSNLLEKLDGAQEKLEVVQGLHERTFPAVGDCENGVSRLAIHHGVVTCASVHVKVHHV